MVIQSNGLALASIGNCRTAALIDDRARIVWWCFPRFDSDPVFSRLLAGDEEKGFCDVVLEGRNVRIEAAYERNTPVVRSRLFDADGNAVLVTDFAPRFRRFERVFNPPQLYRRIEPISGIPRIKVRLRPTFNYGQPVTEHTLGSNHVRFHGGADTLRVTTDVPLSYLLKEAPFALVKPVTLIMGTDEPLQAAIDATCREGLERTLEYWTSWVRALAIPLDYQREVIRAAVTLKLCNYEETGAIIAAHTTSIPESPGSRRNWDYRYCWLRDAYFVIKALNRLGATQTMESYIHYITNVAVGTDHGPLKPVYGIVPTDDLTESVATHLSGMDGAGSVRIGNQAAEQVQHDAYGSVILAGAQMFIDERLPAPGGVSLFRQLEPLGHNALRYAQQPDAGPWEYRGRTHIHTHSATMCWVACDRLGRIARRLGLDDRAHYWSVEAARLRDMILTRAWNPKRGVLAGALDGDELDASVLLLAEFGLIEARDERFVRTVAAIGTELRRGGFVMRYTAADDFGTPETAFLVCQFWYIDALVALGRRDEARELFAEVLAKRNKFGLLSEDIDTATGTLWGNIPQTYSMAGIVNTGRMLSRSWQDAWRDDARGFP